MLRPVYRLSCAAALAAAIVPLAAGPLTAADPPATSGTRPGRLVMTTLKRPADEEIKPRRSDRAALMRVITRNVRDQPNAFAGCGQALTRGLIAHAAHRAARVGAEVDDDLVPLVTAKCPLNGGLYHAAARTGCLHAAWRQSGGSGSHVFTQIAAETAPGRPTAPGPGDIVRELDTLAQSLTAPAIGDRRAQWPYGAGGEVFVALMFLTAMLQETGAEATADWTATVDARLIQTQNAEGSWTGSSCINSRVFCTSSTLLVLLPTRDGQPFAAR